MSSRDAGGEPVDGYAGSVEASPAQSWLKALALPLAVASALSVSPGAAAASTPSTVVQTTLASRLESLQHDLQTQQALAAQGHITGAQALTRVLKETARQSRNADEFVQLTQALFVANDWIPEKPVVGRVIPPTSLPQPAAGTFKGLPTTGWKAKYRDTRNGVPDNDDQTHHLVAFLSLGYHHGAAAASAGSFYHKLEENRLDNHGDINLGRLAGKFGAQLGHSTVLGPTHPLQGPALEKLVDRLCDELTDPAAQASPSTWSLPDTK
jgi:hypothetical protein